MENSSFQFVGFKIKKTLMLLKDNDDLELSINFKPSGILNKNNNTFVLKLIVIITDELEEFNIEIETEGIFTFLNLDDEKINNFLFLNSPAILFPYIRAYISSITSLSGISPIILPTLNLSGLKDELKDNIKIIKKDS